MLRRLRQCISKRHVIALCAVLLLAACQRTPAPADAVSGPEAAVQALATHLRDNDLVALAQAAVPPADYVALEAAWKQGRSRWPLTELPLGDQWLPLLATLSAPDSERTLQQAFDRNVANQNRDLRDAARALGSFGQKYIKGEGIYTDEQRAHYVQVVQTLSQWAQQAPLGDPKRAATSIAGLARAARATRLTSEVRLNEAGMQASLRRLSPFFAETRTVLGRYGLPLDASFSSLRVSLVEQERDRARVRVRYRLGTREIDAVVSLQREGARWYLSDTLRHARKALSASAPGPSGESPQARAGPANAAPSPRAGHPGAR